MCCKAGLCGEGSKGQGAVSFQVEARALWDPHLRSAKRTKQEIRELMMLVIVDQRTGEKAFTPAALFSLPVGTDGSQA